MEEKLLRDSLEEAQKNGKVGLIIWKSVYFQNEYKYKLKRYNAFSENQKDIEETAFGTYPHFGSFFGSVPCDDVPNTVCFSVPVNRLLSENEFFNKVLTFSKVHHYTGPVEFV